MTTIDTPAGRWARCYPHQPQDPALRLFCFPYAGAGASIFKDWQLQPETGVQLWAMQPPGRENRMGEPPLRRWEPLLTSYLEAILPLLDRPFALFGHSVGALVAFELARLLRLRGGPAPERLFLSAHRAPELPSKQGPVSHLEEPAFLERLLEMAGPSPSAIRDPELLSVLAPLLRADFELCENYRYVPGAPLSVPFTCYAADDDSEVDPPDVAAWERHTTGGCRLLRFDGGHLFIRDRAPAVLADIAADLSLSRWM